MTTPGIDVKPTELTTHASHVHTVGDEVQRATDGAKAISLNDDAFGIILNFIIGDWFTDKEQDICGKYDAMSKALDTDEQNIRNASTNYVESDEKAHNKVNSVNTGMDLPL